MPSGQALAGCPKAQNQTPSGCLLPAGGAFVAVALAAMAAEAPPPQKAGPRLADPVRRFLTPTAPRCTRASALLRSPSFAIRLGFALISRWLRIMAQLDAVCLARASAVGTGK